MKIYEIFIFITTIVVLLSELSSGFTNVQDASQSGNRQCSENINCAYIETCHNNQCTNVCYYFQDGVVQEMKKCGVNAFCYVSSSHTAACKCFLTHRGNPDHGCFERTNFFYDDKEN